MMMCFIIGMICLINLKKLIHVQILKQIKIKHFFLSKMEGSKIKLVQEIIDSLMIVMGAKMKI